MRNGFSLIELLAVIIILAILLLIAVPSISGLLASMNEKIYDLEVAKITEATKAFTADNIKIMPTNTGDLATISLAQLKLGGYIEHNLKNPITRKKFPNDMEIVIKRTANEYLYIVKDESGSDISEFSTSIPFVIMYGPKVEKIPLNLTFTDQGIFARDELGIIVDDYDVIFKVNGEEVPSIDTSIPTTYTIHYLINFKGIFEEVVRTVEIID